MNISILYATLKTTRRKLFQTYTHGLFRFETLSIFTKKNL